MIEYLSKEEIEALDFYRKEFYSKNSNPLVYIEPKSQIKIIKNIPALLQEKGYLEVKRESDDEGMEMFFITLKDKFFKHFNIG